MFEQINLLLSFVFALAMTHLLSTAAELVLARNRVIFSGPHAIWMFNAVLMLLTNWLTMGIGGGEIKHWTPSLILVLFTATITLYLVCATLAIRVRHDEPVDMHEFFESNRLVIFGTLAAGSLSGMVLNYATRAISAHPNDWIRVDVMILPTLAVIAVAACAKPQWLQMSAACVYTVVTLGFFANFAVTN